MRIKSLTLHGFKSFADRTKVELHEGITAVVGPNGCGKSNISDALRWVLGEQRPTVIRGSRMDEAIFGGTEQRRPIHRAEVSLELSNEDGSLPVPYSEVLVGRTVYRGGESEYSLNNSPCRLRDIQDLCRDTGLGANAYAVIEGRMIDAILSDRAEERRALFEEAAAIGRYKDRRRVALRRLEQAEGDLLRLDDVLVEVRSKVRSLARQRGKAAKQVRLRERLLQLEVAVADARLQQTAERLTRADQELEALQRTEPSEVAELQTAETEAETLRIEGVELERERSAVAHRLEEFRRALEERERERLIAEERGTAARARLETLSQEIAFLVERSAALRESLARKRDEAADAEAEHDREETEEASLRAVVEALESSRDEAASIADQAREALESARREHDRFDTEVQTASDRAQQYAKELERCDEALRALDTRESKLQQEISRASGSAKRAAEQARGLRQEEATQRGKLEASQTRVRELRERVDELEGDLAAARARASRLGALLASGAHQPDAVSELMADPGQVEGVETILSECMEVPPELARAVESHLGPYLHGVVVRDWSTVERVRVWLEDRDLQGGVLLLPLDPGPNPEATTKGDSRDGLLGKIEVSGPGAAWVSALLGGVDLRGDGRFEVSANPWVGHGGQRQDRLGAVHLGRPGDSDGVLSARAELRTQREAASKAEAELGRARGEAATAEATVVEMREGVEARETERRAVELLSRELDAERAAAEARLARLQDERRDLSRRIEELEVLKETALELDESGDDRRKSLTERLEGAEGAVTSAQADAQEAREKAQGGRSRLHDLQLRLARAEADLRGRRDAVQRISDSLDELTDRISALETERAEQESVATSSELTAASAEEAITGGLEARAEWETKLSEIEERISECRSVLGQHEANLREARKAEREHADRRHALELEVTQLRATRSSVHERLEAEWGTPLDELRQRAAPIEGGDLQGWEEELDRLRLSISRIGPVNLLAQKEYDEEKERLEFLLGQRDDLLAARDDLRDSIRRINRSAAESFTGTFEQIRANFQRTFRTLFEGGECDLWLEDPSDPLDSPIEISASPRGKRTQRIHLLSGGERALTALALLFAIYLVKPSPFCLMDEVDAPLDETNILRFVNMLQEFKKDTQFLVITHNARTIEAADWIYGVTMQEPGVSSIVGVQFEAAPSQVA